MRVRVNREKCIGCGACVSLVPEVFEFVEGLAKEKVSEINDEKLKQAVKEAAEICPTGAIEVEE
ncbi:MAG: ferredoxin [Candidatus Aenigmatarchaeota archaeon]